MTARPTQRATALAELPGVPGDFARLMGQAEAAIHGAVTNRAIWAEEAARTDAPALPWPLPRGGSGLPDHGDLADVLDWLAFGAVALLLEAHAHAGTEPDMPALLRVVKRGTDRAEAILAPRWKRRQGGWRDFVNWLKARRMAEAARLGLKGRAAAEFAGMSVAGSYRAQHRGRGR
jgi:hypothetical protein